MTRIAGVRELAVRIGDSLTILADTAPDEYPLPNGRRLEREVEELLPRLVTLVSMTRIEWKRRLLEQVGEEVTEAREALLRAREGARAQQLFQDAESHFREYEKGTESRVAFVAGADGSLTKTN
jgi:hypothetical protein